MNKTKSGFTIVELLIVIVVIGILAAITIVAYNGIQERAQSTAIISRATAYIKAAKLIEAEAGTSLAMYTCIAPSSYSTCTVGYWGGGVGVNAGSNALLATYSGLATPVLGKYGIDQGGAGALDSPSGTMAINSDWYGAGKAVLMYTVGPSSDCGLGPLVDSNHTSLAPAGQKYTIRTSSFTRCEVRLN